MESQSMLIWKAPWARSPLRCTMSQLAEECFELKVLSGRKVLTTELFDEPEPLMRRARELLLATLEQHHRRHRKETKA